MKPGAEIRNKKIKLLSRLGEGGFGEVFLAQVEGKLQALKVVDTSRWSESEYQVFNAMLMNEASHLNTLCHPAFPLFGDFFAEGSRYFLIMEWIKGRTLDEHVQREGALDLNDGFALLGTLIEILEYLHRRCEGVVVFGDLKPANIIRTRHGCYRLVDFGTVSRSGTKMSHKIAVFSPPYSAPERALAAASDPAHDIFSLGATGLFALCGTPPAPKGGGQELKALLQKRMGESADGWGRASLQGLEHLMALLFASLEEDPSRRPSGIRVFSKVWQRVQELRERELPPPALADRDEIVRLLYKNK